MIAESLAKKALGRIVRPALPLPLTVALAVAELALLTCSVAKEAKGLCGGTKRGGRP